MGIVREKVEPGIWRRQTRNGMVYEITWRDCEGKQRRATVRDGGVMAARRKLREKQGARDRGERHTANPRLRFAEAAEKWLDSRETTKRPETRAVNEQMVRLHLRPRFGNRRMDAITPDDAAGLVAAMRAKGYSEGTIRHAEGALGMIFKYAARRLGGPQANPVRELLPEERAKVRRRKHTIYQGDQLRETIAAAHEPYRTLFSLDAVTGARESEIIAVRWKDIDSEIVSIKGQVTRQGESVDYGKTDTSVRSVPVPPAWVAMLERYRAERALQGHNVGPDAYVFCTKTGGPLDQRNVRRELRRAQKRARTPDGRPTFPALHEGRKVERGEVPDFHAFRHTAASRYIAAGMTVEEVADLLGDVPKTVQEIYRQQIDDAKRRRARMDLMAAAFGSILAADDATEPVPDATS
jgi:integrase